MADRTDAPALLGEALRGNPGAYVALAVIEAGDARSPAGDNSIIFYLGEAYKLVGANLELSLLDINLYLRLSRIAKVKTIDLKTQVQANYFFGLCCVKMGKIGAITHLEFAADNGHANAAHRLATIYANGIPGVLEPDIEKRNFWLLHTATLMGPETLYNFAIYHIGQGDVKEYSKYLVILGKNEANRPLINELKDEAGRLCPDRPIFVSPSAQAPQAEDRSQQVAETWTTLATLGILPIVAQVEKSWVDKLATTTQPMEISRNDGCKMTVRQAIAKSEEALHTR